VNRLTHARVWSAIDALAHRYGLSASGLAKRAALDPTSFNSRSASPAKAAPLAHHRKHRQVFPLDRIDWMARIVWASQ
jgi:hypothetical protein